VKQRAYNIDYTWKPANPWIDLQASVWATRTNSKTNSSGGVPGDIVWFDIPWSNEYDRWKAGERPNRPGLDESLPNTDGRFNTRQGQALYAKNDRTGLLPKMRKADFRINYFRNTTKNIIDRNDNLEFEQYDKQLRTGAEISARFDSGRYYGSFGLIRTIRNEVCHAPAQVENHTLTGHLISGGSKPLLKYPQCVPGGMDFSGYLVSMQQPRWSADTELGTRLLNGKLDLGARLHWHNDVHKNYITAFRDFIRDANKYYDANLTYESPDNMRWAATTVVDAYVRYRINKKFTAELVGTNLTNRYYMDPFSRSFMPAPGRTFRIGLTGKW